MSLTAILYKIDELEKEEAKNIYERFILQEYVSTDELRALWHYEKYQLSQARIEQNSTKRALASNQFEQINHKDYSLSGWLKKGLLGVNSANTQLKSSSIDMHISKLEELIKKIENEIDERNKKKKKNETIDSVISVSEFLKQLK